MNERKLTFKSIKTAIIIGAVILIAFRIQGFLGILYAPWRNRNQDFQYILGFFSTAKTIPFFVISAVSVAFGPVGGLIICVLVYFIEVLFSTAGADLSYFTFTPGNFIPLFSAFFHILFFGLALGFWSKLYKFRQRKTDIKTLLIFITVQVVSLILSFFIYMRFSVKQIISAFPLLLSCCFLFAIPNTVFTCIVLRKRLSIAVEKRPAVKSALRIIGRAALLLVVVGFFLPVACERNAFEIAEDMSQIYRINTGISLYVLFISSLAGGILLIPLILKKRIPAGLDAAFLIISIGCVVFSYSILNIAFFDYGELGYPSLQAGGYLIITGLACSLLTAVLSALLPDDGKKPSPPAGNTMHNAV